MANVKGKNERPKIVHNQIEYRLLSDMKPNPKNPRKATEKSIAKLAESIKENPTYFEARPILLSDRTGEMVIVGGEQRWKAANLLGMEYAPSILFHDLTEEREDYYMLLDNVHAGVWDEQKLQTWGNKTIVDWGLSDIKWKNPEREKHSLSERFIVPPFSILNQGTQTWQERKKAWFDIFTEDGQSRKGTLKGNGGTIEGLMDSGVSIFDPVLAEVITLWYGFKGGKSFDCFAGDSSFGFVNSTSMEFTGIELREEQVRINNETSKGRKATYICDDGCNVLKHIKENSQDLLFSCPPYYDLEVYSTLPNDASNQSSYSDFLKIITKAFTDSIKCLKDNRFAVIVCSDVRDKKGFYLGLPQDIIRIFRTNGMHLYNDIILYEPIGQKALLAGPQMALRKVKKTHQNVLVFFKGNPKKIKEIYGVL